MTKHVPDVLREHILPFGWDVKKLWNLDTDTERIKRVRFDYLLELPLWSSIQGKGMLFDIAPIAVIRNPSASPYQTDRLARTDTSHPLDFLMYEGRPWILDGVHRLAKLYIMKQSIIKVRIHDSSCISKIKVS